MTFFSFQDLVFDLLKVHIDIHIIYRVLLLSHLINLLLSSQAHVTCLCSHCLLMELNGMKFLLFLSFKFDHSFTSILVLAFIFLLNSLSNLLLLMHFLVTVIFHNHLLFFDSVHPEGCFFLNISSIFLFI